MAHATLTPPIHEWPLHEWPDIDRQLWFEGLAANDGLDGVSYADGLRPASVAMAGRSYAAWLNFLSITGRLDPATHPADRITAARVRDFLEARRARGNKNSTLIIRLASLRRAVRIMQPDADCRWLVRSIYARLPIVPPTITVIDSKVLYDWGIQMMEAAAYLTHGIRWRSAYRDGLIIAILAARAPRLRSIAGLRLGQHMVRNGDNYRLILETEDIKTGRPIACDLPPGLTPYVGRYLTAVRPELLSGKAHDWLWVTRDGGRLSYRSIRGVIQQKSMTRFGIVFGPHRFRHGIGTTAPIKDPSTPGIAAALLGISTRVLNRHYNRADQASAAKRFHASLKAERKQTRLLASRLFRKKV